MLALKQLHLFFYKTSLPKGRLEELYITHRTGDYLVKSIFKFSHMRLNNSKK